MAQVVELVEGFETSFGIELLATVHWVAARQPSTTLDEVIVGVYEWNNRKQQFSERQIGLALRRDVGKSKGFRLGVSGVVEGSAKIAEMNLEEVTFNPSVLGSNPRGPTTNLYVGHGSSCGSMPPRAGEGIATCGRAMYFESKGLPRTAD